MKIFKFVILLFTLPAVLFGQKKTFEIFGSVTGEYKERLYFFYENDFAHKDSLSSKINNGKFYFKARAVLPILCRFHFGENTNIQELYIDNSKTFITFFSQLTDKNTPDSLGGARTHFELKSVKGSKTEDIIRSFQTWELSIENTKLSKGQKNSEYFAKLQSLLKLHPNSKASAYLLSRASFLDYSQVIELSNFLDASLRNTFEWQSVLKLLNGLDKEQNRTAGNIFKDVTLKDTSENYIDTKTFRNKYILIDFWASWCKPCRALNPELKILYGKFKDKGFEIIGVSLDEDVIAWKKAIIKDALPWTQLIDEKSFDGDLSKYYDIGAVPARILLDKEGKIVAFNLSTAEIKNILEKAL